MAATSIVFTGIAPHPPIMVPEVGREAIGEVRGSIAAMEEFTERVLKSGAETIVIISPHGPLEAGAFIAYSGATLYGDFSKFRAPEATVQAAFDEELLSEIQEIAAKESLEVQRISRYDLDHGTAVPLYFLQRGGFTGSVVALGYSFLSNHEHIRFGNCITKAAGRVSRPTAFVASGDLSHRLLPSAPAGYEPQAYLFDEQVVEAIQAGNPSGVIDIDQELRRIAGECGYRSMLVAFGVAQDIEPNYEVLHYEAPFGVGYLVAQLTRNNKASTLRSREAAEAIETAPTVSRDATATDLPSLARCAVESFVCERVIIRAPDWLEAAPAGCFVSIKTFDGVLRGCIGTIEPARQSLGEELIANAINAATCDPRFLPISPRELPHLTYSVDILFSPELAMPEELDPREYGVIVEDELGSRRGLLLPDLEGVDTVEQQLQIARQKAGIGATSVIKLSRFRVVRYREEPLVYSTIARREEY